jgi:phenylalanine-4-hydroxylase
MDPTIEHRPFTLDAVRDLSIDYDAPQDLFFVADSFEQVLDYADQLVTAAHA